MVYVLLVILALFTSCSDYLTQAEDLKKDKGEKTFSLSADSLKSYLSSRDLGIIYSLKFQDRLIGGRLQSLSYELQTDDIINPKTIYLWNQDSLENWSFIDSSNTLNGQLVSNESITLDLLNNKSTMIRTTIGDFNPPIYSLGDLSINSSLMNQLEIIHNKSTNKLSSQSKSLYAALVTNLGNAHTHLNLAINGTSVSHLQHVHHYLSGLKQVDIEWWKVNKIANVDSIGVLNQLDYFITTLEELEKNDQISLANKAKLKLTKVKFTSFYDELNIFMDAIVDISKLEEEAFLSSLNARSTSWNEFLVGTDQWLGFKNWNQIIEPLLVFDSRL